MANILSTQYNSVFSQPRGPLMEPRAIFSSTDDGPSIMDIQFTEGDIEEAINELKNNAAAGPDGYPAVFLKECKAEVLKPLYLIWRSS